MLTDADRKRILAEEEERIRVRRELEPKPPEKMSCMAQCGLLMMIVLVAFALIYFTSSHNNSAGSVSSGPMPDSAAVMAEGFVKERLKSPSTAHFSSYYSGEETVSNDTDGKFIVKGWVDSQNGFGAMLRTRWICKLHSTDGGQSWTPDSVVINDP